MMYVKLFGDLLQSSIWAESDRTRLVWITLLLMADEDGIVHAKLPGIAHFARVPVSAASAALTTLQAPDPVSRTTENEGRRIEEVPGGYAILNYTEYRKRHDKRQERERTRERVRKHREGKKAVTVCNADVTACNAVTENVTPCNPITEAEAEAEAEAKNNNPPTPHNRNAPKTEEPTAEAARLFQLLSPTGGDAFRRWHEIGHPAWAIEEALRRAANAGKGVAYVGGILRQAAQSKYQDLHQPPARASPSAQDDAEVLRLSKMSIAERQAKLRAGLKP